VSPKGIIIFSSDRGIEETACYTLQRINAINALMDETIAYARKHLPSRVYSKELGELLLENPVTDWKWTVLVWKGWKES
jgi:hypothetical protein